MCAALRRLIPESKQVLPFTRSDLFHEIFTSALRYPTTNRESMGPEFLGPDVRHNASSKLLRTARYAYMVDRTSVRPP